VSREQGGKKVKFAYDTEEQLTAVINEKGETYQFERDTKGNIIKEIGFDEIERTYERSQAGLIQRIQRPGDRWTAYQHDGLGKIIRADYYDDTWETFGYDKNGSLIETENEHVTIKLERDPSGQVIKEWQNDHWIASSYDELGNRSQITSSLCAKIDVARNEMDNVSQITASRSEQAHWTASLQYNELGQEIERILPGDVISKWQYDAAGRPTHHRISSQQRQTRRRVYNWDVNHQLRSMVNELTGVRVIYGYDEFSNLVWSNQGIQPFNSQTGVPSLYFSAEQWLEGEGLNHSAMHGYNELGAGTKPTLTENQFNKSGLTNQEWLESLENHYNNSEIQKFKGDLHVINSDGTKGKLLKANVTPAQAWEETKKWASQKGHPIKCKG